jgi:hypothetical protein
MNFSELLYDMLVESVEDVDAIYKKYYEKHIQYNRFSLIAKVDRFTKVEPDGKISKLGKYARFLLTLYAKGGLPIEDLSLAKEYIDIIYNKNIAINWNEIKSISDFYPHLKKFLAQETQSIDEILQYLNEGEDYVILHNGEGWVIYSPKTEKGACYLGVGSEWCTTWGPLSLNPRNKGKSNRFKQYIQNGEVLYIIVNKKNTDDKVQFQFEENEFKNLSNGDVDTKKYFSSEELFKFFFPITNETSEESIKLYFSRRNLLPIEYRKIVTDLYKSKLNIKSNVDSLYVDVDNFDPEFYKEDIHDKNVDSIECEDDNNIVFHLKKCDGHAESLRSYISTLNNAKDDIPSDMMGSDWGDDLRYILEEFWEQENELIRKTVGEPLGADFELFYKNYDDIFYEKFKDSYESRFDEINYANIESSYSELIKRVTDYVDVENYHNPTITFNLQQYNQYVNKHNILKINSMDDFLEGYMEEHDIDTEDYENEVEWDWPGYDFFEDNIKEWWEDMFTHEMVEVREKLNMIKSKLFNNKNTYEDNDKFIKINDSNLDYGEKKVYIEYKDKKKKKEYKGWILIDNLPNYVTMNMLAETYFGFKRHIN